jgi:Bacterial Ig domain
MLFRQGRVGVRVSLISWLVLAAVSYQPISVKAAEPSSPQSFVDTSLQAPTGRTIAVSAGGDFQAALNAAQPGDVITLQAGATFTGPFTLPSKSGSGWITVRSAAPDSALPAPGTRSGPSYSSAMPKIIVPQLQTDWPTPLQTAPGAHHYRLIGIEVTTAPSMFTYTLVQLGWFETDPSQLPHHIIIDRCYIHADPVAGARRGVALNGNYLALIDSYVSGIKQVGYDSQAVFGFNGRGPLKIVNNYLEGAGENILFGGAVPRIANSIPSDIEIRQNHLFKPYAWKTSDPDYNVKNLLEVKMGQRILVDGNLFEHTWPSAQQGWAIVITPRTEDGSAPWVVVQDITFTNNVVRDVSMGFDISGVDGSDSTPRTARVAIRNNLFDNVDGSGYGPGHLLVIPAGISDLIFEHNTSLQNGDIILVDGRPTSGFVFRNNIMPHNDYGVTSPRGTGTATLNQYFPGAIFAGNVIVTSKWGYLYPQNNFFPPSLGDVGFADPTNANYRLSSASRYKNAATDGQDVGVDFDELDAGLNGETVPPGTVDSPLPPPPPQPTPAPAPTPPPADNTPPVVSITNPANGSTVSGIIEIGVAARDDRAVTGVDYWVDGALIARYFSNQTYFDWDTRTVATGSHQISVIAYDGAGNHSTAAISVNVIRRTAVGG